MSSDNGSVPISGHSVRNDQLAATRVEVVAGIQAGIRVPDHGQLRRRRDAVSTGSIHNQESGLFIVDGAVVVAKVAVDSANFVAGRRIQLASLHHMMVVRCDSLDCAVLVELLLVEHLHQL